MIQSAQKLMYSLRVKSITRTCVRANCEVYVVVLAGGAQDVVVTNPKMSPASEPLTERLGSFNLVEGSGDGHPVWLGLPCPLYLQPLHFATLRTSSAAAIRAIRAQRD